MLCHLNMQGAVNQDFSDQFPTFATIAVLGLAINTILLILILKFGRINSYLHFIK